MIEESNEFTLPNDPAKREKIKQAVINASNAMTRRKAESDYITESLKAVGDEVGVKAKHLRRMAKSHFKADIHEVRKENEELSDAYDIIFGE